MTRINVIDTSLLTDQHLRAELREITRIPNTIVSGKAKLDGNYPKEYTLGAGHVKFFYPRLKWLKKRHQALVQECEKRGFKANNYWPEGVPERLMRDWKSDDNALQINVERVLQRFPKNAKMCSKNIDLEDYKEMLK